MKDSKKFIFDIGLTFFASTISTVLGLVITLILGRYFGASDLGLYRIATSIFGITMIVAAMGIPSATIKLVSEFKRDQKQLNEIISSSIINAILLGISFSIITYLLSGLLSDIYHEPGLYNLLILLSIIYPFSLLGSALLSISNGLRVMKIFAIATIVQSFLMMGITLILIHYGYGVTGVILGTILSMVGYCLYLFVTTKRYYQFTVVNYVQNSVKTISFGLKILAASGINQINYQADILLIGYFLTAAEAGYYSIAAGLSVLFWLVPQSIQTITYPAIAEYWSEKNYREIQTLVDNSLKYSSCILLPISMLIIFFSADVITVVFGDDFSRSALPLQILILGTLINGSLQRPIGSILYSIGMPELNLKIFTLAATGNVLLNIILIPLIGLPGAAAATTFSYIFITVAILYYTHKYVNIELDVPWFSKIGLLFTINIIIFYLLGSISNYLVGMLLFLGFIFAIWTHFLSRENKQDLIFMLHKQV